MASSRTSQTRRARSAASSPPPALSRELLPLASPVMDQVHKRYLQHFVEQDVVGHMESDLDGDAADLGRMRVAIAFADLAGYTRLTEEQGELHAVDAVERSIEAVEITLPDEARVIKTIGGEVLATRAVVEHAGPHLEFERIAEVRLKGFAKTTEIFIAKQRAEEE